MVQNVEEFNSTRKFRCFQPQKVLKYQPYADDFGPMNLASVARFIEMLSIELESYPSMKVVYCVDSGRRQLSNAVFLLGAYLILKLGMECEEVMDRFAWFDNTMIEHFRDPTSSPSDFDLTLEDCWRGLSRGVEHGWVSMETDPGLWGMVDIDEYSHLDHPLNADLHTVVPGKFVAFRGPRDLGGADYSDAAGYRQFAPAHYLDLFRSLGVTDVVRLNESEYDSAEFTAHGLRHHDLSFDDCTFPPPDIIAAFLAAADAAEGLVAVHCKAGLGRTGTLIALYLMRTCGFTAREAIGWLRIMRPGSVIGEQQQGLCAYERGEVAGGRGGVGASVDCGTRAAQVVAGMERRCSVSGPCAPPANRPGAAVVHGSPGAVGEGRDRPCAALAQQAAGHGHYERYGEGAPKEPKR